MPGRKITIQLDPDDEESNVELSLVDELITKEQAGQYFQRRITKFNNGEDTSRVYAVREITHKKRLPGMEWKGPDRPPEFSDEEDDEDDDEQKLNVEVIFEMTTQEGSGQTYRKRIYKLNWDGETNFRNTHIKRIFRKDENGEKDPDIWIDVRRKDQFITFEGSGLFFRRRLTSVAWDDGEDDNPFDTNDLPALPAPTDPDQPYRLDFLQDIVNINIGGPILAITFTATHSGGLNTITESTSIHTPAAPEADPPLPIFGGTLNAPELYLNQSVTTSADGEFPDIENPITKEMREHMVMWHAPDGTVSIGGGSVGTFRTTVLINLARFRPDPMHPTSLTFKLRITPITEQHNHYFFLWSYVAPPGGPGSGVADFITLFMTPSEAAAFVTAKEAQLAALPGGVISFQVDDPVQLSFFTQTSGNWTVEASTYGSKKDYQFDASGNPEWDVAGQSRDDEEVTGDSYAGTETFSVDLGAASHLIIIPDPTPPRVVTIKVDLPSLTITLT